MYISKPIYLLFLIILLLASCAEEQKPTKLQHGKEDSLTALSRLNPQKEAHQTKSTKVTPSPSSSINVLGIGISLRDSIFVRLDSSMNANIIGTLNFADHVTTLGKLGKRSRKNYDYNGWVQVETEEGKSGWCLFKDFWIESQPVEEAYYNFLWRFKNPYFRERRHLDDTNLQAKTFKILKTIENRISSTDTIYVQKYTMGGGNAPVGGGAYVAYLKNRVYQDFGLYKDALASLQTVVENFEDQRLFEGRAGAVAALEIAKIYKEALKDTIQAIAQFRDIIVKYPNDEQTYNEASDWPDYMAASSLIELLESHPKKLMKESEFILSNSEKPIMQLIGYLGKVKSYGLLGNLDEMFKTALLAIEQYPKGMRRVGSSMGVHYPSAIVFAGYEALKTQDDVRKFSTFCDTVQTQFAELEVGTFAALMSAELAYQTNSDQETCISRYQKVKNNFDGHVLFRLYLEHHGIPTWLLVGARLDSLKNTKVTNGTIGLPNTQLKIGSGEKFDTIKVLPKGTKVKILYPHQEGFFLYGRGSMIGDYSKVELEKGEIGWVLSYNIH